MVNLIDSAYLAEKALAKVREIGTQLDPIPQSSDDLVKVVRALDLGPSHLIVVYTDQQGNEFTELILSPSDYRENLLDTEYPTKEVWVVPFEKSEWDND